MKSPMVSELAAGQPVTGVFLVQSKEVRQRKTGEPYLSLVLMDRTGDVDAKMWDNVPEVMETFERDDFVKVKGDVQLYQGKVQITVHRLARVDDRDVDLADFLPASQRDPEEMFTELQGAVAVVGDPHLRSLLESLLADPAVAEGFKRAPAAKAIHHAWLGGLLEHVLSLLKLGRLVAPHYPLVDGDLLTAGIILHDLGKIRELGYMRSFGYTTEGQLLGHIQIALRLVADKLQDLPDFPPKLRNLVEHMVLSHHGQLEFGSPKVPVFAEALLLHHLDNLDSKMETLRATLNRDLASAGEWTGYNAALERSLLNKTKYLSETPEPAARPARPAAQPKKQTTLFGDSLRAAFDGGKEK